MANLSLFLNIAPRAPSSVILTYIRPHIVSSYLLEKIRFCSKKRGLKRMESKVTESKVTVMKRSMSDEVFDEAMKLTANAFASQENDKDIAEHIKTQLEKKFHGSWYVVFFFFLHLFGLVVERDQFSLNRSLNKNIST